MATDDKVLEQLHEANRWLRILALPPLLASLGNALTSNEARKVYQSSDGRTSREVGREAGVSHTTVQSYWRRWAKLGLVEQVAQGRFARLVELPETE